jgi:transcriptional regulator with XRE-family HTH domain
MKQTSASKKTMNAVEILMRGHEDDPELLAMIQEERINVRVAQQIYDLRTNAGLTQSQLAKLVGTTQPVIARLEDADYRGHSLRMLSRIALALDKEVVVSFRDKSVRHSIKRSSKRTQREMAVRESEAGKYEVESKESEE